MDIINSIKPYLPTLFTLTFIIYHILRGYKVGVIAKIMSILSLVVIVFATKMLSPLITNALYSNGLIKNVPSEYMATINWGVRIILFVGLNISMRLIIKLFGYFSDIPVIGPINKILGGLCGMVEAVLYLWIMFFILRILSSFPVFNKIVDIIKNVEWLNSIYEFNPIQYFVK